jgi:hypothetical protein
MSPDNRVHPAVGARIIEIEPLTDNPKGMQDPMNITAKIRARRAEARTRRAVNRAITMAATPAMRHELVVIAQSQAPTIR